MTGRELAAKLLALPNPDLPVITREDDICYELAGDPHVSEQESIIWEIGTKEPIGPFIVIE